MCFFGRSSVLFWLMVVWRRGGEGRGGHHLKVARWTANMEGSTDGDMGERRRGGRKLCLIFIALLALPAVTAGEKERIGRFISSVKAVLHCILLLSTLRPAENKPPPTAQDG